MGVVKSFSVLPRLRAQVRKALKTSFPSDVTFTAGAALYDRAEKAKRYADKEFMRRATEVLVKASKTIREIEVRYYG